jgi:hypothetical protein
MVLDGSFQHGDRVVVAAGEEGLDFEVVREAAAGED